MLAGYWVVQAVVLVAFGVLFYGSTADGVWDLRPPGDYLDIITDNDVMRILAEWVSLLTALQWLLVLPVQSPVLARRRGKSVWFALASAGALMSLLVVGFVAAVSELVVLCDLVGHREWSWSVAGVGLAMSWSVCTVLLVRYARRSTLANSDLLTRVSRMVFAGTVIETAALIPIDVMVRRKADCYCFSASLVVLILSGAIGIVVAGPAIFLPLISRRPAWLRSGRCEWCGYDRAGLAAGAVCPECGKAAQPSYERNPVR